MEENSTETERRTIRLEDLGEPIQKLLQHLHRNNNNDNNYNNNNEVPLDEDEMELLTYVSVKDMAKIYSEFSKLENSHNNNEYGDNNNYAEGMWEELKSVLVARRAAIRRREEEIKQKEMNLLKEQEEELERQRVEDEEDRRREEEEEKEEENNDKDNNKENKDTDNKGEEEAEKENEETEKEEARRRKKEKKEQKRKEKEEKKRKKREARAREAEEEHQQLLLEKELLQKQKQEQSSGLHRQRKEWDNYVLNHPLEFPASKGELTGELPQEKLQHLLNTPSLAVDPNQEINNTNNSNHHNVNNNTVLSRTYTPKCPQCHARFAAPPLLWNCPFCFRRTSKEIKVWQPDHSSNNGGSYCMVCNKSVGRFTRHHCRLCGRLVCGGCSPHKAILSGMGYGEAVKVCNDCANMPSARVIRE